MQLDLMDESQVSMLREALRGLADDGLVAEEALQNVAGFESVAAALEEQLGHGPWPVEKLEELFFGTSCNEKEDEDCQRRKADVSPVRFGRFASPPRRHLPRRHTVSFAEEAHQVVDGEEADDDWFRLVGAVEEALREDEHQDAAQLGHLLRRMWQIMQVWRQQRQNLQQQFARAAEQVKLQSDRADNAETARLAAEAAEAATLAQLEEQEKRFVQGREALKGTKQELEEARMRIEQQEVEMRECQQRLSLTEDKLRRRLETCEEKQQQTRATTPRVPDGQDSLARKLIAAEAELEALHEELLASEEASAMEHKRVQELEAALEQSHRECAEWKEQQALQSSKRRSKPGGPSNRSRSSAELATTLSEDLQSSGDAAAGPKASKHTAEPMVPKLAIFDRKARLQAQLSRPSSSLQPQRPETAPTKAPSAGSSRPVPARTGMPSDMASLSRLLGGGFLGGATCVRAKP